MQDRRCHQVRSDYRRRGIDCVLFLCLKSTCSLSSAAAYRRREIPQHSSQTPQVWPSPSFFRCTRGHWTACGVCRGSVVSNCYLTALYTDITDLPTPQFKGLDTLQKRRGLFMLLPVFTLTPCYRGRFGPYIPHCYYTDLARPTCHPFHPLRRPHVRRGSARRNTNKAWSPINVSENELK